MRDLIDRLRGQAKPADDDSAPEPVSERHADDETIVATPNAADPAETAAAPAPAAPTEMVPPSSSRPPAPSASPRPPPAPSPFQPATPGTPTPTPVARHDDASEMETRIDAVEPGDADDADETVVGVAAPAAPTSSAEPADPPDEATVLGQAPPVSPVVSPASTPASFPRPSAPQSSVLPVPRRAANHRLQSEEEVAGVFVGLNGPLHRLAFVIPRGRATLGRATDCVVRLDDAAIEPLHAELESAGSRTSVIAIDAARRIEVNGEVVVGARELCDGDVVRFGATGASMLRYRTIDALNGPA